MSADTIISSISTVLVGIAGLLLWYQIRSTHEWSRRKATHDLLMDMMAGSFMQLRRKLEEKIEPYDETQTYSSLRREGTLTPADERTLNDILNYFEQVAVAIKHNILDDDLCFEMLYPLMSAYLRWAMAYILDGRKYNPRIWVELEAIVLRWEQRESRMRRLPPKNRL